MPVEAPDFIAADPIGGASSAPDFLPAKPISSAPIKAPDFIPARPRAQADQDFIPANPVRSATPDFIPAKPRTSAAMPSLPDFSNQLDDNVGAGPVVTNRPSPQPSPSPGTLGSNAGSTVRPATPEESSAVPSLSSQDVQHIRQTQFTDAARQPEERQLENVGIHPARAQDVAAQEFPDSDDPVGDALKYVRDNPQLSHPEARAALASAEYQVGQRQQKMAQVASPETRLGLRQVNDVLGGVGDAATDLAGYAFPDAANKAGEYVDAGTKTPGGVVDTGLHAIGAGAPLVFLPGPGWVAATAAAVTGIGSTRRDIAARRAAGQDIGPGQELAAATGQGLVNAATMKAGLGAGQNAAEAVGGGFLRRAAAAIPATAGEMAAVNVAANTASNAVAASTYDPNRPLNQGLKESVIGGLASGVPFGLHGAMHGGAEPAQPTNDQQPAQTTTARPPIVTPPPEAKQAAAEPWQQPRDQFIAGGGTADQHRAAINDALAQGKTVPQNVLADYVKGLEPQGKSSSTPTLPDQQPPKAIHTADQLYGALRDTQGRQQSPPNPEQTSTPPQPGNVAEGEQQPASKATRPPKGWTRADIEKQITQRAEDFAPSYPNEETGDHFVGKQGPTDLGPGATTFWKKLPTEIEDQFENLPEKEQAKARKMFTVSQSPNGATGADAMAELGADEYFKRVVEGNSGGDVEKAKDTLRNSPEPRDQLLTAIHDKIVSMSQDGEKRPAQQSVDPKDFSSGTQFKMFGHDFNVQQDENGYRVMRDGDEFPMVPVDAVGKIPIDKGTVKSGAEETATLPQKVQVTQTAHQPVKVMATNDVIESSEPPKSGKLDAIESWATKRLAEKDAAESAAAQKTSTLDPALRRRKGSAGPLDPERVLLKTVQLAARLSKSAVATVKQGGKIASDALAMIRRNWVKEMLAEHGEDARPHLGTMWMNGLRLARMDDQSRSEWLTSRAAPDRLESEHPATLAKEISRFKNPDQLSDQLAELRTRALSAKAGSEQSKGIAKELAGIAQQNLPNTLTGKLLGRVAAAGDLRDIARGTQRVAEILSQHNLKKALGDAEDLVGKGSLKLYQKPAAPTAGTGSKGPRVIGDVSPDSVKEVKLSDLAIDTRDKIKPLIQKLAYEKKMAQGATMPTKTAERSKFVDAQVAATERIKDLESQIRVHAANDLSQRQVETAGKIQTLKDVKDQAVQKIDAPPASGEVPSGEGPRDQSRLKTLWRTQYSPDTILSNIFGEKHPAFDIAVPQMRWAREQKLSTIRDFHEGLEPKLAAAGIPSKSAALDKWLSNRELVNLPSGKQIKLTRPEMLDLYGHQGDEQTSKLIDNGIGWKFEQAKQAEPIKLTRDDIAHITSQLTPEEKAIVDHFKDFRDKLFPAAAAARLSLGQSAPDKIEGNYPRARDVEKEPMPTGWRGIVQRRLENITSQKERGADRVSPVLIRNAFDVMADDIHNTADLIHVAEPLHNVASVLQHPDVANALARKYGPQINRQVDQFLFDAAEQRTRPPANLLDRAWRWLASRYSTAALTLNPNTLAKHYLGGSVMASSQFDPRDWQAGMVGAFKPGTYERMLNASGTMWSRFEGEQGLYTTFSPLFERKVTPEAKLGFTAALQRGKIGQAFAAIPLLKNNDAAIHKQAFVATENYIDRTQPGLTGEARRRAVLDKFIEAVERTQTGNNPTSISYAASKARESGPIQQALMLFTTAANKRLNMLARWGQLGGSQRARLLASLGASALLTSGATYGIRKGTQAIGSALAGGTPQDKDQARRDTNNFVWNIIGNATDMSYAGAYLTDIVREYAQRGRVDSDSQVGGMLRDAISGTANVANAMTRQLQTPAGTKKAAIARQRVMTAFSNAQDPFREMFGDPTVPLTRLGGQALQAADYQPKPTKYANTGAEPEIKQLAASGNAQGARGMYDQNRIGLPSVARMLESAKLDDAVNLLNILTPKDRQSPGLPDRADRIATGPRTLEDQLRDRIARSDLPASQQDQLLHKAGMTGTTHMSLDREFLDLARRASRAKTSGDELSLEDLDRLKDLRSYRSQREKILAGDDSDDSKRESLDELSKEYDVSAQPAGAK